MYAAVLFIGIQNGQTVQPIVDVERTVFYREKAAGMYSALPYAFAQVNGHSCIFKQKTIAVCFLYYTEKNLTIYPFNRFLLRYHTSSSRLSCMV